jgi:hypothetical protein
MLKWLAAFFIASCHTLVAGFFMRSRMRAARSVFLDKESYMWQPGIGVSKIVLMLFVICLLWLLGAFARRLAQGVVVCFAVAMVVTPGDLYSMLIVGISLSIAFASGVLFAPNVRTSDEKLPP